MRLQTYMCLCASLFLDSRTLLSVCVWTHILSTEALTPPHPVARRCIPTLVDLDDGVQELFDVEAAEEIQAAANSSDDANIIEDFGDLVYTVNVESIVNGSL